MPALPGRASAEPSAIAPDGISIHSFDVPVGAHVGIAEGRIPTGSYAIHRHLSLEQYTYVVSGSLVAVTASAQHPHGRVVPLAPGSLLLTFPSESLQFINESDETARVLFICAPPYPTDDSDTQILAGHGPLPADEAGAAIARLEAVREQFDAAIDRRIAALRTIAAGGCSGC